MRHIHRGEPLAEFQRYVEKESPKDWESFSKEMYELYVTCRKVLMEEQGNISGYTEMPLKKNLHIDHFKKQSLFPWQMFDWRNFVVDEKGKPYGADRKDESIVLREKNEKLINPVEEDPHLFFTYQRNGNLIPVDSLSDKDRERAIFTIEVFGLNHEILRRKRLDMMCLVENYVAGGLSMAEVKSALTECGFPSVLEYMESYAE